MTLNDQGFEDVLGGTNLSISLEVSFKQYMPSHQTRWIHFVQNTTLAFLIIGARKNVAEKKLMDV